jgi:hypothetical protein
VLETRQNPAPRSAGAGWVRAVNRILHLPKRLLVGRPIRTELMGDQLLPKKLALPVFCSDPLSSNAYATEEILLMLSLGGLALLHLTWWVAAAVILLLLVVVASYRQTCYAYPNGGGAYAVAGANLGRDASLVAASALLVDYVLTVAVSVAAGVALVGAVAAQPECVQVEGAPAVPARRDGHQRALADGIGRRRPVTSHRQIRRVTLVT